MLGYSRLEYTYAQELCPYIQYDICTDIHGSSIHIKNCVHIYNTIYARIFTARVYILRIVSIYTIRYMHGYSRLEYTY